MERLSNHYANKWLDEQGVPFNEEKLTDCINYALSMYQLATDINNSPSGENPILKVAIAKGVICSLCKKTECDLCNNHDCFTLEEL